MTASLRPVGEGLAVSGEMTLDSATALLAAGVSVLKQGSALFDLAAVSDIDSSGLAVLFGWQRAARETGNTLRIVNPPHNLLSLAAMYGVTGLLPLS